MQPADLVLKNGNVVDVIRGTSGVASIAVVGERIAAVGPYDSLAPLTALTTRVVDLTGKTVVPGFIDAHAHLVATGLSLQELDLSEAQTVRDILDLVAAKAKELPEETLLRGWGIQENLLAENRFPTKEELDAVAPRHYVRLMRSDGHSSVVNTKMLRYLGYTAATPDVEVRGGEPTGVIRATAQANADPLTGKLETPAMRRAAMRAAAERALQVGLTTVHTLEGSKQRPHEEFLEAMEVAATLPIRTVLWYQTPDIPRVQSTGLPRIGGCIMVDGAPGSWTGALFEPYSDRPDTRGVLYFTDEAIESFVLEAHRLGYQIAMHATCQRAVEQALRAYEKALAAYPRPDHRMRIEHGYGMPTRSQLERMAQHGIIWSTQPAFLHFRMDMYYRRFGDRWREVHPHRTALDCGVAIAGGSDSFVTPLWPLLGIHCAVNHPVEEQRVGVREALRWFTINAAFAAFEETDKGTIEAGKLADLTVLGRNILLENALTIKDIPVEMTIVGGQIRYARTTSAGCP